jgi:hypothetical protein
VVTGQLGVETNTAPKRKTQVQKMHQNERPPISLLPPSVLAIVFHHMLEPDSHCEAPFSTDSCAPVPTANLKWTSKSFEHVTNHPNREVISSDVLWFVQRLAIVSKQFRAAVRDLFKFWGTYLEATIHLEAGLHVDFSQFAKVTKVLLLVSTPFSRHLNFKDEAILLKSEQMRTIAEGANWKFPPNMDALCVVFNVPKNPQKGDRHIDYMSNDTGSPGTISWRLWIGTTWDLSSLFTALVPHQLKTLCVGATGSVDWKLTKPINLPNLEHLWLCQTHIDSFRNIAVTPETMRSLVLRVDVEATMMGSWFSQFPPNLEWVNISSYTKMDLKTWGRTDPPWIQRNHDSYRIYCKRFRSAIRKSNKKKKTVVLYQNRPMVLGTEPTEWSIFDSITPIGWKPT